jgi:predicted transposase YbfD/YdcC
MSSNASGPIINIQEQFSDLEDPRVDRTKKHALLDILVIAMCAVICGAETWVDVENFGKAKEKWFKKFLGLPNGIPSHDTFGRVFGLLDADQFQSCFVRWVQAASELFEGQIVPIDGKKLRRSHDKGIGKDAIWMVSAWALENQLVLGQLKVEEKSNEITAIPQLLQALAITDCIVTIDAMGCQKEIAKQIIAQGADYLLALKANQGGLHQAVQDLFNYAQETGFADCDYHKTVNKGHGRIEIRECWTTSSEDFLAYLPNRAAWSDLESIVMVKSERRIGDDVSTKVRYYISSLPADAKLQLEAVRGHWGIENQAHWVLDVAFREDDCRIRKDNGPQNFAVLRHIALNLLKQEQAAKCGIKAKRLKAAWDEDYLLKVLASLF